MTIGDRLLKLRRERNLSQEDLANELDVSRQTISKWETNQSLPDFDKIVPICNYFGITTDELLTGSKDIVRENQLNIKSTFARNVAIAVMLYIIALVAIILFAAQFNQPIIGVSIFFTLIAAATGLLIYNGIYYSEKKEEKPIEHVSSKQKTLVKQVTSIVDIIGLIAYFILSFLTHAWSVTWIIFIVVVLVNKIIELLFTLSGKEIDEEEKENK